jgi:ribose-phosphate pyrophosphokinase
MKTEYDAIIPLGLNPEDHNIPLVIPHCSTFPDGTSYLNLNELNNLVLDNSPVFLITATISTPHQIWQLMQIKNILDNMFPQSIVDLNLPYIPFGREDRHMTECEPFSLKIFSKIINDMNFRKIVTTNPHSIVSSALIDRLCVLDDFSNVSKFLYDKRILYDIVLVAPDAGAYKRVSELAKYLQKGVFNVIDVVQAHKKRNIHGVVTEIRVEDIQFNANIVVYDDIIDGGKTFIELAKFLPDNRKSLTLYATHGIFSQGRTILHEAGYDNVESTFNFLERI